jgi:hypothetical protein
MGNNNFEGMIEQVPYTRYGNPVARVSLPASSSSPVCQMNAASFGGMARGTMSVSIATFSCNRSKPKASVRSVIVNSISRPVALQGFRIVPRPIATRISKPRASPLQFKACESFGNRMYRSALDMRADDTVSNAWSLDVPCISQCRLHRICTRGF